jgi:hypothetical protein
MLHGGSAQMLVSISIGHFEAWNIGANRNALNSDWLVIYHARD